MAGGRFVYVVNEIPRRWRDRTANILSAYRFIGLISAFVMVQFITPGLNSKVSPVLLVIIVSVYTLFKVLHPTRWHQPSITGFGLLAVDIILCAFLVTITGGIYSPFLLYTLAPVLEAALFMDSNITVTIAGVTAAYVMVAHVWNPFFPNTLTLPDSSQLSVYIAAVCLSAVLPYLINVNLRQSLQSEEAFQERQRLSREMHDGIVQTISALSWQLEVLNRRLAEMGIDLKEAKQLGELTQKAQQDTSESLEFIRSISTSGTFSVRLNAFVRQWNQDFNIRFHSEVMPDELHLEPTVELQIIRICQEAMTNVKKHAKAHNVTVNMDLVNKVLVLKIADDGDGFDMTARDRDGVRKGHGLNIMRERAESIGGNLTITSAPGRGTELRLERPNVTG
jgi:signal transduction histidine kinase